MHWEWIKIINKWIWTKEAVIYSLNTLDVKCTHIGDFPKFSHIIDAEEVQEGRKKVSQKCSSKTKLVVILLCSTSAQYLCLGFCVIAIKFR